MNRPIIYKTVEESDAARKARHRRWRLKYPDKVRAKSAKERAARLQRIPLWANLKIIEEFYLNCPPGHHVDHIIPLSGKLVSGLHVIENLQYLLVKDNLSKSNKFTLED